MCIARLNIITLTPEMKIAQLILLPFKKIGRVLSQQDGEIMALALPIEPTGFKQWGLRPERELLINGKKCNGLLDTGADVSVISYTGHPSGLCSLL